MARHNSLTEYEISSLCEGKLPRGESLNNPLDIELEFEEECCTLDCTAHEEKIKKLNNVSSVIDNLKEKSYLFVDSGAPTTTLEQHFSEIFSRTTSKKGYYHSQTSEETITLEIIFILHPRSFRG